MKLGSFFFICKPTFQVPNKTLECLFDFQIIWMVAEIRASFVLVQIVFFLQIMVPFISYTIVD